MGEAKGAVRCSRLKNHQRFDGLKICVIGTWKRRRRQIRDIAIKLGSLPFSDFANLQNRLSEWNKWSHALRWTLAGPDRWSVSFESMSLREGNAIETVPLERL